SGWPRRPGPAPAGPTVPAPASSQGCWCSPPARPWPWRGTERPATSSLRLPLLRRREVLACAFALGTDGFGPIGQVDQATASGLHGDGFGGNREQLAAVG